MPAKVLLVDDEPAVLSGFERSLYREFDVETAVGGELGLKSIIEHGPFAVVVSDMRMPGMNGAQFLGRAREVAPDTVRMLLTGFADLESAAEAVNQGNIYRFLTKPCAKEVLVGAINAGVEQHLLMRAEKEILESTLMGSIKVLADFLNAANPEAFGRSVRIARYVRHVSRKFKLEFPSRLDAAATLSQLGCITLDSDVIQRAFVGIELPVEDQARFDAHPETAMRMLSGIPRLEAVAWMIGQQLKRKIAPEVPNLPASGLKETLLGAKILKIAVAFDGLWMKPVSEEEAIRRLRARKDEFDSEMVEALEGMVVGGGRMEHRRVATRKLATGMVLDQEIRNSQGMLIAAKGQEITRSVLVKLENFFHAGLIDREVAVLAPASE